MGQPGAAAIPASRHVSGGRQQAVERNPPIDDRSRSAAGEEESGRGSATRAQRARADGEPSRAVPGHPRGARRRLRRAEDGEKDVAALPAPSPDPLAELMSWFGVYFASSIHDLAKADEHFNIIFMCG